MISVLNKVSFDHQSCEDMGLDPIKCLSTVGATAKEIREMMGVVSKSASSSNQQVTVNF